MKRSISFLILLTFFLSACQGVVSTTAPAESPAASSAESSPVAETATELPASPEPPAEAPTETEAPSPTAEPEPTPEPAITITDALGRQVSFAKPPERIVLTGKGVFMLADAVFMFPSVYDRVIAVAAMTQKSAKFLSILDPNWDEKTEIERTAGPEQIAALQPDCVILKTTNKETGEALAALGIPTVFLELETFEQYDRDLETLGILLGEEDRAIKLRAYYRTNVANINKFFEEMPDEQKPSVLFLYHNDQDGEVSFNVPPANWIQTQLVETAGGLPVWTDIPLGNGWTKVNLEQIAAWDPDYIFVTSYTEPILEIIPRLRADEQWKEIRAVKNNRLRPMLGDIYSYDQPDTRWPLGLYWLVRTMHPSYVWPLDFYETARNFYANQYDMDVATYEEHIKPLLRPYFQ